MAESVSGVFDPASRAMYPEGAAFVDGAFVPIAEARIPLLDWGFLRSDCTYDVVHVWHGRFFRLDCHLDRFLRNAAALRLEPPLDRAGIVAVLMRLMRLTGLRQAYVEMICTLPGALADSIKCSRGDCQTDLICAGSRRCSFDRWRASQKSSRPLL